LDRPLSTYGQDPSCRVIEPGDLTLAQAIFFSEHPAALRRDYPAPRDQASVFRRMDRLFAAAERDQPLEWQAFRTGLRRRETVGTEQAASRIVAFKRLGARVPSPPPTPS
jgi:hypothetical protein